MAKSRWLQSTSLVNCIATNGINRINPVAAATLVNAAWPISRSLYVLTSVHSSRDNSTPAGKRLIACSRSAGA